MSLHPSEWYADGPVPFRYWGEDVQSLELLMLPGQRVIAQPGAFICGAGGFAGIDISFGRRFMDPFYRKWSGEEAVLQQIRCDGSPGRVLLGAPKFGRIVRLPVRPDCSILCQRGAFIASTGDVDLGVAFTRRIRAGVFGGSGVVFQRASGSGDVFLHALGSYIDWVLPPDKIARISTSNILAFEDSVGYDVQSSGGFLALMFGGEGMFLSQLEGPGRVIVQSINPEAAAGVKPGKA